eukprot:TRINITY_DN1820_c0_g1_i1.p1 TRINITY_DN1820_c0_g1~~TRINITY_DN1820_c0_g1_i1.p1  ORF type:complete len:378 (-),score=79.51 TRINITY_DN1820_c0_g1_i1:114-1133(-)
MDALPLKEEVQLDFASKVTSTFESQPCGVMHACGHDVHTSVLMGVAQVLSENRSEICGSVKFIFQPAEEKPPKGETGGAQLMVEEGVLSDPSPVDAIFGLHVASMLHSHVVGYRPGPMMASGDVFEVQIIGKQTHAGFPWSGIDPIVTSAHTITALQSIISRQTDITASPSILSISTVHGGNRDNIIPQSVKFSGTLRTFSETTRSDIQQKLTDTCTCTARASGATAQVKWRSGYDVTINDEKLSKWSDGILRKYTGDENVKIIPLVCASEDFSYYQKKIPGFFFFVGCLSEGVDPKNAAPNHSPLFYVDEKCIPLCVKLMTALTVSYLKENSNTKARL